MTSGRRSVLGALLRSDLFSKSVRMMPPSKRGAPSMVTWAATAARQEELLRNPALVAGFDRDGTWSARQVFGEKPADLLGRLSGGSGVVFEPMAEIAPARTRRVEGM